VVGVITIGLECLRVDILDFFSACMVSYSADGTLSMTNSATLEADLSETCIASPNYGTAAYSIGDNCHYVIQVLKPTLESIQSHSTLTTRRLMYVQTVQSSVTSRETGVHCDRDTTCQQWVEVKYKNDLSFRGPR
jgi:hypothetical protein